MLLTRCAAGQQRRCADAAVLQCRRRRASVCVCVCSASSNVSTCSFRFNCTHSLSLSLHTHTLSHCMYVSLSLSLALSRSWVGQSRAELCPMLLLLQPTLNSNFLILTNRQKKKKLNFKQFFSFRLKRLFPIGVRSAVRPGSSRRSRRSS